MIKVVARLVLVRPTFMSVHTYLCVYGMSREKSRKLAAPWSSLV